MQRNIGFKLYNLNHPIILEKLAEFKRCKNVDLLENILPLMLYNSVVFNIKLLKCFLFDFGELNMEYSECIEKITEHVKAKMIWKCYEIGEDKIELTAIQEVDDKNTIKSDFRILETKDELFLENKEYTFIKNIKINLFKERYARKFMKRIQYIHIGDDLSVKLDEDPLNCSHTTNLTNSNELKKKENTDSLQDEDVKSKKRKKTCNIQSNKDTCNENLNQEKQKKENSQEIDSKINKKNESKLTKKGPSVSNTQNKTIITKLIESQNFTKIEKSVGVAKDERLRFQPLNKKASFVFKYRDKRFQKNFTTRRNKELRNYPVIKMTYIKSHDQVRPFIYETFYKKGNKISHAMINDMGLDYDKDSDESWVMEDGENIESSELESDESEEEYSSMSSNCLKTEEKTEKTEKAEKKAYQKPFIRFDGPKSIIFKDFTESWFELPLEKRNFVPENLMELILTEYKSRQNNKIFYEDTSMKYRVLKTTLMDFIKKNTSELQQNTVQQ